MSLNLEHVENAAMASLAPLFDDRLPRSFEKLCGKARRLHVRQMKTRSGVESEIPQVLHRPYAELVERAEVVEDFQKRAALLPSHLLR